MAECSQISSVMLSCVVLGLRIISGARRSACAVMQLPSCLVGIGVPESDFPGYSKEADSVSLPSWQVIAKFAAAGTQMRQEDVHWIAVAIEEPWNPCCVSPSERAPCRPHCQSDRSFAQVCAAWAQLPCGFVWRRARLIMSALV